MFTPDSNYIVTGGARKISLLDVKTHELIDRFPENPVGSGGGAPTRKATAPSPDDALPTVPLGYHGPTTCEVIALSPDGKQVASVSDWVKMPIRIWDFETGRLVRSIDADRTEIRTLVFSPDGKRLAAGTAARA